MDTRSDDRRCTRSAGNFLISGIIALFPPPQPKPKTSQPQSRHAVVTGVFIDRKSSWKINGLWSPASISSRGFSGRPAQGLAPSQHQDYPTSGLETRPISAQVRTNTNHSLFICQSIPLLIDRANVSDADARSGCDRWWPAGSESSG